MTRRAREFALLDLLVDGPSSVAALYVGLQRFFPELHVDARGLLDLIRLLEDRGMIEAGHETANGIRLMPAAERAELEAAYQTRLAGMSSADDGAIDELGMWVRVTEAGRLAWRGDSRNVRERMSLWSVAQRPISGGLEVTIHAVDEKLALDKLNEWLAGTSLLERTRRMDREAGFLLHDGTRIESGVALVVELSEPDAGRDGGAGDGDLPVDSP